MARRSAPAHRQHAVNHLRPAVFARDRAASPDREADRRTRTAAKSWRKWKPRTRPTPAGCGTAATAHGVGIREQPVEEPGTAHVQQREHAGARHGEQRHGFRETVDGVAPLTDCSSSRIAEISVPAWPIPIHHTKLTMANPQPTGMLMPQMPTPLTNRANGVAASAGSA